MRRKHEETGVKPDMEHGAWFPHWFWDKAGPIAKLGGKRPDSAPNGTRSKGTFRSPGRRVIRRVNGNWEEGPQELMWGRMEFSRFFQLWRKAIVH